MTLFWIIILVLAIIHMCKSKSSTKDVSNGSSPAGEKDNFERILNKIHQKEEDEDFESFIEYIYRKEIEKDIKPGSENDQELKDIQKRIKKVVKQNQEKSDKKLEELKQKES